MNVTKSKARTRSPSKYAKRIEANVILLVSILTVLFGRYLWIGLA
jgi:hypothetical protein